MVRKENRAYKAKLAIIKSKNIGALKTWTAKTITNVSLAERTPGLPVEAGEKLEVTFGGGPGGWELG